MIIVTSDTINGKKVIRTLGMVKGNTIRTRNISKDILAVLKNVVGGEISEYTKMMAEAREQAIDRMADEAIKMGANAIITTRFSTNSMMKGAAELLAYGTAVVIADE